MQGRPDPLASGIMSAGIPLKAGYQFDQAHSRLSCTGKDVHLFKAGFCSIEIIAAIDD